ncbi:MAG: hypothetical protein IT370_37480 [Deltaproteobacteria bacterium]|nr:hypothetical protein [Deltaproteobacteria bacterium]
MQHSSGTPEPPSAVPGLPHLVPATLEALILECLAKERADRPQSMRVIEERLRAISDEDVIELDVMEIPSGRHQAATPSPAVTVTPASTDSTPVPLVTTPTSGLSNFSGSTERMLAAPRSRRLLWTGAGVLAVAAAGAVLLWSRSGTHRHAVPALVKPPAPATVQISFDSDPPGAEVFRKGDSAPLGQTPFTRSFPASDERSGFVFQLRGHGSLERDVSLARDSNLAVVLALAPEPAPSAVPAVATAPAPAPRSSRAKVRERTSKPARAPKSGAGGLDKGGVIDAFGD